MNTEKTIKNQAKKLLEGNWISIIASAIAICVVFILLSYLSYMVGFIFGVYDLDTSEVIDSKAWIAMCLELGMFVAVFFLSPLINGFYKIVCNVAVFSKGNIEDLFFFFRNKKYFKTLRLNLIVFGIFYAMIYSTDLFRYLKPLLELPQNTDVLFGFLITLFLGFVLIITILIKMFFFLVFVHYPITAYAFNDNMPLVNYTTKMFSFSLRNFLAVSKLVFSFMGWIALCFFVVPAFYVLPYLMTSMAVSAKWLFALDRDRGLLC